MPDDSSEARMGGLFMNIRHDRSMPRRGWLRAGLLLLAASIFGTGCWALLFPRAFYDDFPLSGWGWVSTLGTYNEHLVRGYGAMNLALCVLLAAAAINPDRSLSRVAVITLLVFAVPHFVFHLTEAHHFSPFQNLAQLGGLGVQILLPVALLALTGTRGAAEDHDHVEKAEGYVSV